MSLTSFLFFRVLVARAVSVADCVFEWCVGFGNLQAMTIHNLLVLAAFFLCLDLNLK